MLVQSGTPFGFDYTAFDGDNALFIAGNVYDISTGSPVFLSQVPMVNSINGTYSGLYTGIAGKVYLIETSVYTDGTYTTIDTSRSPGSDTYQCQDLTAAVPPTPTAIANAVWNALLSLYTIPGSAGKKLNDLESSGPTADFISTITNENSIFGTITEIGEIT